jgi:hypothetical protein
MLQRNTSELIASLDGGATSWPKAVLFSILMADPLESALRNCNAAPQNSSNASANWPRLKEP